MSSAAAPLSLSRPFILRPVATSLLMLAVLIAGLLAWRQLPVSALPQVDYPVMQVFTFQPGASPDVTARTVTAPLERRLGQIPGLSQMSSTSSGGASVITLKFALEVDLGVAEQDVQAALQSANSLLPSDLPAPPIYRKVNPADVPILTLAIGSDTLPLPRVVDMVDTRMAGQLSRLPGVGLVSLAGGQRPAIRVQANSRALAANGLTLEELRTAIAAANNNQPKGSFDGQLRSTMLDANDQLRSAAEYQRLIVAWRDGAPLRLADVAKVEEGAEDRFLAAWAGMACAEGQTGGCGLAPAVLLNIQRQPGANVIAVADQVRALLPQLTATLPANVKVQIVSDRTESIRASVRDVQKELLFAIALVVLVTFVFLRTLPATLIPSVAVPLSLVGTFAAMLLLGYSLNNLSLMALTIATGFVVDDAIVMLENIARHREEGAGPMEAALKGASEIGFTLVSLTVSLVAVLIPLLFMADVVGRLFHEFAVTLAVAIGISLVVSLTLTPMMAARMLRQAPAHAEGRRDWLSGTIERYGRGLDWVLARQPLALLAMAATLVLTALLYLAVPKGFFPVQDAGAIQVVTEAPQSVSFGAMAERQQALARALLAEAPVQSVASFIGVDGSNATLNSGRMLLTLAPHAQRSVSASELIERLRERARDVGGIEAWFQPVQELGMEDRISRTQYQFTLSSPDSALLGEWTGRMLAALKERPELIDVASNLQREGLQAYLEIDRDAAARLGLRMGDIASALQSAFGQRQVSTLFTHASQYRVVLESDDAKQGGLQALEGVYVQPAGGGADAKPVPLSAVARAVERRAPLAIEHQGQFPAVTLSFNLAPGHSLGEAVAAIEAVQRQVELPVAVELAFQGAAEGFRNSQANTLWLILAAVVVMYLVLGMLYESAVHPLTILSTLPSATVGALAALLLAGRPLDLIAVIGIVLLIGLVKKNGIMMVDFALDAQRRLGLSPREAIHRAALLRFRPILMTTLAALFGAVPLMLASGSGAELRQPLGIVMVGGLIVSQLLTLFTTPVVYLAFDRLARRRTEMA
ncbi:MAG: efflux RND transporter permease subunit [Hydrogenophaga sp.]|uniref:efflux RND transporter permease subunit n=1 Tax=Hydrogenophaga sp. TaxID=1904254 RepID=UPI0025BD8B10|nr:efflux RND transporter permease subunit [Hydrogenophaga sp.]MBU7574573.1 efflux RND transporter permease subunit [Hydrogenophaga sp.]